MIIVLAKVAGTLLLNGYVFGPMCADAGNGLLKNNNVSERAEIITRGVLAVSGLSMSAAVSTAIVDAIMKQGTKEAAKAVIRAMV